MEQNRRSIKILKNNKGQFAIEAVLLMSLFVGTFLFVTKQLREKQVLQKFTETSVGKVKTMAEYGAWKNPCKAIKGGASQKAANCHPNSINRALSSDPL
jgi:hypothetical protein